MGLANFGSRHYRQTQSLAVERSLNLTDFSEELSRDAAKYINLSGALLSIIGVPYGMKAVRAGGGLKYFLPFYKYNAATGEMTRWTTLNIIAVVLGYAESRYIDWDRDPTVVEFTQNSAVEFLDALFAGKAFHSRKLSSRIVGLGIAGLIYLSSNHVVRSIDFLRVKKEANDRIIMFETLWTFTLGSSLTLASMFLMDRVKDMIFHRTGNRLAANIIAASIYLGRKGGIGKWLYWPLRESYADEGHDGVESLQLLYSDFRNNIQSKFSVQTEGRKTAGGSMVSKNEEQIWGTMKTEWLAYLENLAAFVNISGRNDSQRFLSENSLPAELNDLTVLEKSDLKKDIIAVQRLADTLGLL